MRNPGGENFDRKYILPLKKYSLSFSLENEKVRRIPGHDNPRRSVQVFIKHYDLIGDPVALEALDHRVWPSYRAPETFISVYDDDVGNFYDRRLKPPPFPRSIHRENFSKRPRNFLLNPPTLLQIVRLPNILAQLVANWRNSRLYPAFVARCWRRSLNRKLAYVELASLAFLSPKLSR